MTGAVTPGKAAAPTAASTVTRANTSSAEAMPDGNGFLLALDACSAEADAAPVDQALADTSTPLPETDALPLPAVPALPPAVPALPVVDAAALLAQGAFAAAPTMPASVPTVGAPALKGAGDAPAKAVTLPPIATAQVPSDEPAEAAVPWRGVVHANAALTSAQAQAQSNQATAVPSDARALAPIAAAVAEPVIQAALASAGTALRRGERSDERASSAFSSTSGADTHAAFAPGGSALMPAIDAASAGAAGGQSDLTERMVEQVSWWLSQRTQGAELTLNIPGASPVSVSIQLRGNEAQVAFRSDQSEARQLLANAMPQLKDMLGAEGLLLSGSSVGTSDSGGRHGDAPPGAPVRAGQVSVDVAPAQAAPARPLAAGRTLDLYV